VRALETVRESRYGSSTTKSNREQCFVEDVAELAGSTTDDRDELAEQSNALTGLRILDSLGPRRSSRKATKGTRG